LVYVALSTKCDIRTVTILKELYELAQQNGIVIEHWPLRPPLEAVYVRESALPPTIVISNAITEGSAEYITLLAHELGHHFTTTGDAMPCRLYSYANQLDVGRAECRADKWAADYLIPWDKLSEAVRNGITERWELAEHFGVTERLVAFRLGGL